MGGYVERLFAEDGTVGTQMQKDQTDALRRLRGVDYERGALLGGTGLPVSAFTISTPESGLFANVPTISGSFATGWCVRSRRRWGSRSRRGRSSRQACHDVPSV